MFNSFESDDEDVGGNKVKITSPQDGDVQHFHLSTLGESLNEFSFSLYCSLRIDEPKLPDEKQSTISLADNHFGTSQTSPDAFYTGIIVS